MTGNGKGRRLLAAAAACALLLWAAAAAAGDDGGSAELLKKLEKLTKTEAFTLEGEAFLRYTYSIHDAKVEKEGEKEAHPNTFELWRFYFGFKSDITKWLSIRFTADVGPEKTQKSAEAEEHTHDVPGETSYQFFVKFAWFQLKPCSDLALRAGVIDNPWSGYIDNYWGYRYVARNNGDEEGSWNTADLGAYLRWQMPRTFGEAVLGVYNGPGYKRATDVDENKDLGFHVLLTPFAPLSKHLEKLAFGGYVQYPMAVDESKDKDIVVSGFAGYSHTWVTVAYNPMYRFTNKVADNTSVQGLGHGIYLRFDTPWKVGVLHRLTLWDPDIDKKATRTKHSIQSGVSYSPVSLFSFTASVLGGWKSDDNNPSTAEEQKTLTFMLSTLFKY